MAVLIMRDGIELRQLPLAMIGLASAIAFVSFILTLLMCANCVHGKRKRKKQAKGENKSGAPMPMEKKQDEVPERGAMEQQDNQVANQTVPLLSAWPPSTNPSQNPHDVENGGRLGKAKTGVEAQAGQQPPPLADIHGSDQRKQRMFPVSSDFRASDNLKVKAAKSTANTTTMTSVTAREFSSASENSTQLKKSSGEKKVSFQATMTNKAPLLSTSKVGSVAAPKSFDSNFLPESAPADESGPPSMASQGTNESAARTPGPVSAPRSAALTMEITPVLTIELSSSPSLQMPLPPPAPSPSLGPTSHEIGVIQFQRSKAIPVKSIPPVAALA